MKRSEMLALIQDEMPPVMPFTDGNYAERILRVIEEAGMTPPIRNADMESSYGYAQVRTWKDEE